MTYSLVLVFFLSLLIFNVSTIFAQEDLDVFPPKIVGPFHLIETTSSTGTDVFFSLIVHDNIDKFDVPIFSCTPSSGTYFFIGNTTVICSAEDSSGNRSDDFSFLVEVIFDESIPDETSNMSVNYGGTSISDKYSAPDPEVSKESPIPNVVESKSELIAPVLSVPAWVKNNAAWWADDKIDDNTFANGIQFLISDKIILIPLTESGVAKPTVSIPDWVKNNAAWWADGIIDDGEFVASIQFLITEGIITV